MTFAIFSLFAALFLYGLWLLVVPDESRVDRRKEWGSWYLKREAEMPTGVIRVPGGLSAEEWGNVSDSYRVIWPSPDLASAYPAEYNYKQGEEVIAVVSPTRYGVELHVSRLRRRLKYVRWLRYLARGKA